MPTTIRRPSRAPRALEAARFAILRLVRALAGRSRPGAGPRLSERLLADLGLVPVPAADEGRAPRPRAGRSPSRRVVHEMDFAYYAALSRRNG